MWKNEFLSCPLFFEDFLRVIWAFYLWAPKWNTMDQIFHNLIDNEPHTNFKWKWLDQWARRRFLAAIFPRTKYIVQNIEKWQALQKTVFADYYARWWPLLRHNRPINLLIRNCKIPSVSTIKIRFWAPPLKWRKLITILIIITTIGLDTVPKTLLEMNAEYASYTLFYASSQAVVQIL